VIAMVIDLTRAEEIGEEGKLIEIGEYMMVVRDGKWSIRGPEVEIETPILSELIKMVRNGIEVKCRLRYELVGRKLELNLKSVRGRLMCEI